MRDTKVNTENKMMVAALDYAKRGWPVFPCHSPANGTCSCGKTTCASPGKHPRVEHGLKGATTDPAIIRSWWVKWPAANVAIVTGAESGLVVLDVDPDKGGTESLYDLQHRHGQLPPTPENLTGGGGTHLFFQRPGIPIKNSTGALGPGLDVRGDGGYIIAPPSLHVSGGVYEWDIEHNDHLVPPPMPPWLLALVVDKDAGDGHHTVEPIGEIIVEGQRNATLTSLAGSMRRRGMSEKAILAALVAENRARCRPPLGHDELAQIAASVARYTPADVAGTLPVSESSADSAASATVTLAEVEETFRRWLLMPDMGALRFALTLLVGHRLKGDPAWGLIVAPPSGSKTEIIRSLEGIPGVYPLSELTARTFASGLDCGKRDPSLLTRLSNHVLALKDFTTVLTMHREERQAILAQLREIYDGRYDKAWGTGKEVHWRGRLGFVAGVTPIIDVHHAVHQVLGERFLLFRSSQPDRREMALIAMRGRGHETEMRQGLREVMARFAAGLSCDCPPPMPESYEGCLASLADVVSTARSGVIRDQRNRDLTLAPEPEAPARLAKQLAAITLAHAIIRGAEQVADVDYRFAFKVARDCIPSVRLLVMDVLARATDYVSTSAIAAVVKYPTTTVRRALEDLAALSIVAISKAE